MKRTWAFAGLLLVSASAATGQSADLRITSIAIPSTGLRLGDEVLVTTTIRNDGPNPATNVSAGIFDADQNLFWFQWLRAESPDCSAYTLDFNPPLLNILWDYPSLGVGEQRSCVVRLRVAFVPPNNRARLFSTVESSSSDPTRANNRANLPFYFGDSLPALFTVPAASRVSLALLLGLAAFPAWRELRRG